MRLSKNTKRLYGVGYLFGELVLVVPQRRINTFSRFFIAKIKHDEQ